jgi:hypothetical protein
LSGTHTDSWEEFPFLLALRRDNAAEYVPATGGEPSTGMPALWVWGGRTPFPFPFPFPIPRSFPLSLPRRPCPQVSPESR